MVGLLLLLSCAPKLAAPVAGPGAASVPAPAWRLRPGDVLPVLGADARVDHGLVAAAQALTAAATTPDARLTPAGIAAALEVGGYPGPARFVRVVAGPELPQALLDAVPRGEAVDVGWAWRDHADGRRWWVLGWCPRRVELDPVPGEVQPGGGVGVRVDGAERPRLFVVTPGGKWSEYKLLARSTRWVGELNEKGRYHFEVVDGDRVELLFTVRVATPPAPPAPLPTLRTLENPYTAVDRLYARVDELRRANGLGPLQRFVPFEPLAREHAACLAAEGAAAHAAAGCAPLPDLATQRYYPRGHYYENVALADTADEAWDTLVHSPGHLANLLRPDTTHLTIAAAFEPVADPRLMVVWEAMAFPAGEPRRIGDR